MDWRRATGAGARAAGWGLLAGALLSACGVNSNGAQEGESSRAEPTQQAREALAVALPGATVEEQADALRAYGRPLSTGATAEESVARFVTEQAQALGIDARDLQPAALENGQRVLTARPIPLGLMYDRNTGRYKFYLYRHAQVRTGTQVFDSELLTLVRNEPSNPVVWTASTLKNLGAFVATSGFRAPALDANKALAALSSRPDFIGRAAAGTTTVTQRDAGEALIYAGQGTQGAAPRMAVQYTAETANPPGKWRVVAQADTGDVLHAENLILFEDVVGNVSGNVTTSARAMDCAEEVPMALPNAQVSLVGGGTALTEDDGSFVLPNPGTDPVSVISPLGGTYFDVNSIAGGNEIITQTVTPPGPANFLHNPTNPSDMLRAQVNGYMNATHVREFLLQYVPNYPTIATQVNFPVNVNRSDLYCPGNAWYDYSSINFCSASAAYSNTSFGSIAYHEYGHHIVSSGGSGQGPYGEGMSDTVSVLLAGEPGMAYGFYLGQCATPLRTAANTCQYSATSCSTCGSASHSCGTLLSGTIWSVRQLLAVSEPETYVDLLNALVLSSVPMHTGTTIGPSIAVDLLTLDDDDGLISNGTPHYTEICGGFAAHGMACPPILTGIAVTPGTSLSFEGPSGGPFTPESAAYQIANNGPQSALDFTVTGAPAWLDVLPSSGQVAQGTPAAVSVQVDQAAAAALPNGNYSATLTFTNATTGQGNTTRNVQLRVGVPASIFSANFESGLSGFTVDAATNNLWHVSSLCASTLPGHTTPASLYFGLDSNCTFAGGTVSGTVTSPNVEVEDTSLLLLRLKYFLATERNANYDRASVQVSVNGGAFTTLASNHGAGTVLLDTTGVWQSLELDLTSLVSSLPAATVRVRLGFNSMDGAGNSYAGFLVDDVELRAFAGGCTVDADCDDGLSCSGAETCVAGVCQSGAPVSCDDGVACTADSCDELTSCVNAPSNALCADTTVCNGAETCDPLTGCQPGTALVCNDSNACTTDGCDPVTGCTATPLVCNDSNACTVDACDPATGCTTSPLVCNDNNECTTDSCDPATGCLSQPHTGSCTDDGNACTSDVCNAGACTHPDNGTCGPAAFQESGGTVVMEAEHFHSNISRASHTWDQVANAAASGGQLMQSNPNSNTVVNTGYVTGSPELRFSVNFTTTGTYNVWVRGFGPSGDDDSCHVGIDGTGPLSADRIGNFPSSLGWIRSAMEGPTATINVTTPGVHTVSLWMREDGFRFDKLLLTTNGSFTPSGAGPAESPRSGGPPGCTSNAQCDDSNACTTDTCNAGSCQNAAVANGTSCADDGNMCTNDVCGAGVCTHPNNTATCTDDGSSCTNDVCSAGMCTHPPNGSCQPQGPCAAYCSNPVSFSGNYQSGNLGTAATCHATTSNLNGGVCGNLANGRVLRVNGVQMTCGSGNWSALPPKVNGGYCVTTTAGNFAWAYFATW